MVTLLGVAAQISGIILILFYDNTLGAELPTWAYYYFIFVIFFGQTTDAIDGKHARNTKRSSPLGQLVDHGCDSFSNSFIIVMACQSLQYSSTLYGVIVQIMIQVMKYF
jgi:phosphatidylglycerophosphate synthase